ncbi:MAG: hypothetical protein JKY42_01045 [Flavobacteriales bacterium]|nr:hypothetical protein [Flavobacteriales bacterium]
MSISLFFLLVATLFIARSSEQHNMELWTEKQSMKPATLLKMLNDGGAKTPLIYGIVPAGLIKNSIDIVEGKIPQSVEGFRKALNQLPKDANISICNGCCLFMDSRNMQPVFNLLNEMDFTHHHLLNLPKNLKVNWIYRGYQLNELQLTITR